MEETNLSSPNFVAHGERVAVNGFLTVGFCGVRERKTHKTALTVVRTSPRILVVHFDG